ncbi:MAG: hypothetical protein H7256_00600 [Bdellovibrio sp.]|nr:hypothetical protein [Bdellovibrio sp.]
MTIGKTTSKKRILVFLIFIASAILGTAFQNCSDTKFTDMAYIELGSSSIQKFTTKEETELKIQPKTFSSISRKKGTFVITRQPTHGTITSFDTKTGQFTYLPALKFFGDDSFQYVEREDGVKDPHEVPILIEVVMVAQAPVIITDTVGFEMNTVNVIFRIDVRDYHDPDPQLYLSADPKVKVMPTKNGVIKQLSNGQFSYSPSHNFRGSDFYEFIAKNSFGDISKKKVILTVGNPFRDLEPSMAIRGVGCVSCHLSTGSKLISDFGYGDKYFFGKQAYNAGLEPFAAPFSFYNDHGGGGFLSSILKEILVPNVDLPFSLVKYGASGSGTFSAAQAAATTLPQYMNAVRGSATVTVKSEVFIGAPSPATISSRTGLGDSPFVYLKNQDSSPELSGLINKGSYFEASSLTCDGDLTINGTLFLKKLELKTNDGCRIYVTGPIFVNDNITYVQITAGPTNNTNLQLVSGRWINLGIGTSHCENNVDYPITTPSWYKNAKAGSELTPFSHRMLNYTIVSRDMQQDNVQLKAIEDSVVGFQDASCRTSINGESPREVHFERLLLNAPRVDSRYIGQFNGVIIAEVALMSLSNFSFLFDPVFSRVSILPLLQPSDYLVVK